MALVRSSATTSSTRPLTSTMSTGPSAGGGVVCACACPAPRDSRPTALSRSPPRAMASLRTSGPPKGTSGSAAALRLLRARHRGRQGRRREDHGNGCDGHRRSPPRAAGAGDRAGGRQRPRPPARRRPAAAGAGRRAAPADGGPTRLGVRPGRVARRGPDRLPGRSRDASPVRPAGQGRCHRRRRHGRARSGRHPRARQGQAARAGRHARPHPAGRTGGRACAHLPALGQGAGRCRHGRPHRHAGAGRAGAARRRRPLPGRVGDPARGDAGQRDRRDGLRAGGRGRREAGPDHRQRPVPGPPRAGGRPRRGGRRRRPEPGAGGPVPPGPPGSAGRAGGPPVGPPAAPPGPAAAVLHRWPHRRRPGAAGRPAARPAGARAA